MRLLNDGERNMKNYISGKWISVISVILAILLITNSVKTYVKITLSKEQ